MSTLYCCNFCGHVPNFGVNRSYFMSSCGHILCENCCRQEGVTNCPVCQSNCRYADINDNPRPEIKVYFSDPLDTLRQCVQQVVKVAQFQNAQALRYKNQMSKLIEALQGERDSLLDENAILKQKVDTLERHEQTWNTNGVNETMCVDGNDFFVAPLPPIPEPSPFFGVAAGSTDKRNTSSSDIFRDVRYAHGTAINVQHSSGSNVCDGRLTRRHTPTLNEVHVNRRQHPNANIANRIFNNNNLYNQIGGGGGGLLNPHNPNVKLRSRAHHPPNVPINSVSSHTIAMLSRLQNLSSNRIH